MRALLAWPDRTAKVDFPVLANQFEPQSECDASVVLRRRPSYLTPFAVEALTYPAIGAACARRTFKYVPTNYDPTIPRFTQDNVITKGQKTRAQVLGEPLAINGKQIRDFGYQVRQLDEMLRANGAITRLTIVDANKVEQDIRDDLVENLSQRGNYVIVAYKRDAVGQRGGGHISPLGAIRQRI